MTMSELKGIIKSALRGISSGVSPLFSRKTKLEESEARAMLEECSPDPCGSARTANMLLPVTCDLQIVIPAYNAQDYLEACMNSVLSQKTRYSYHVVLVDDGAKDRTPEICDRYASDPRVTVIHQQNRGHAGARNRGLQELFGTYVMFVDSDDILCQGAIEGLLDTAYAHDCDMVEGGAYYLIDGKQSIMHRYAAEQPIQDPNQVFHGQPWGKVYKRELFETVNFPEGYWYEDSVMAFLIFPSAKTSYVCPQMTYYYRINQAGIVKSSRGKPRAVETVYITEMLLRERQEMGYPLDGAFFSFLLLQIRLNQLRLRELDESVQESAFALTCHILSRYYAPDEMTGKEKNLIKALKTKDFGMFKLCCRFF